MQLSAMDDNKRKEELMNEEFIQNLLNEDLRELGTSFLPDNSTLSKASTLEGPCLLQIQKVRNISAPKANEESNYAPQLLRLYLTDGQAFCSALQWGNLKSIRLDTPPGTKLLIKPGKRVPIKNGFLLLSDDLFTKLGGHVEALVKKWEVNRSFSNYARHSSGQDGGPPPWVAFGQTIETGSLKNVKGTFRSLNQTQKEGKENEAFEQQRKANIAEVSRAKEGKTKVFGTGKQDFESTNHTPPQINSVAFKNQTDTTRKDEKPSFQNKAERNGRRKKDDDDVVVSRPSGPSTLFDYLQNHISAAQTQNETSTTSQGAVKKQNSEDSSTKSGHQWSEQRNKETNSTNHESSRSRDSRQYNRRPEDPRRCHDGYHPQAGASDSRNASSNWNSNRGGPQERTNSGSSSNWHTRNSMDARDNRTGNQFPARANSSVTHGSNSATTNSKGYADRRDTHNQAKKEASSSNCVPTKSNPGSVVIGQSNASSASSHQSSSGPVRNNQSGPVKASDHILARYWEDNQFYRAIVYAVAENGATCVVHFVDYGNYEEVLLQDIKVVSLSKWERHVPSTSPPNSYHRNSTSSGASSSARSPSGGNPFSSEGLVSPNFVGTLEFRRSGNSRSYTNPPHSNAGGGGRPDNNRNYAPGGGDARRGGRSQGGPANKPSMPLYQPPAQRKTTAPQDKMDG